MPMPDRRRQDSSRAMDDHLDPPFIATILVEPNRYDQPRPLKRDQRSTPDCFFSFSEVDVDDLPGRLLDCHIFSGHGGSIGGTRARYVAAAGLLPRENVAG